MNQRLKQLASQHGGMELHKVDALAALIGDDMTEQVLLQARTTEKSADALRVAYKVTAPNTVSVQMTREEADAWQAAIANEGNKNIIALLRQVAGTQVAVSAGGKLTDSGDQSKPMTKAAGPTPGSGEHMKALISNALDHVAREGIH